MPNSIIAVDNVNNGSNTKKPVGTINGSDNYVGGVNGTFGDRGAYLLSRYWYCWFHW